MNILLVGGTFDYKSGKPSYIIEQLENELLPCAVINGGYLDILNNLQLHLFDVLIWMPNIDNSEDKILPTIKAKHPRLLLISSKRVIENTDYKESDVVGRLLKTKSNLGIMIEKKETYRFKLLDPLGNIYCNTTSTWVLAKTLLQRVNYLKSLTRVKTILSKSRPFEIDPEFIGVVREYGEIFSTYINAVNPNRLLGNASTRCSYGFPAIKQNERMFVTRRNINKTEITSDNFVEVLLEEDNVYAFGQHAPSVDTPAQIRLFNHYPNIKYIIHGHVYIEDAPYTEHKIPCGYIEEVQDITNIIKDPKSTEFKINLLGHGCLIACSSLDYFKNIPFTARDCPEY